MIRHFLWVGLGGFLGSILRFACYFIPLKSDAFWITLAVNILGSFVIGLMAAYVNKGLFISEEFRLFITVGICGGFTTFSTFSMEISQMSQQGRWMHFALYLSISILGGIFAFIAGQKCI